MIAAMRRLHERGRDSRGIAVDRDGSMLGPDCVLVRRTPSGFRCLSPDEAHAIQAATLGPGCEPGWLFDQARRIADALAAGETALAQIHGLRIRSAISTTPHCSGSPKPRRRKGEFRPRPAARPGRQPGRRPVDRRRRCDRRRGRGPR
jgi:hypothetical protein